MNILVCDDVKKEADSLAVMLDVPGLDNRVKIFSSAQKVLDYVRSGAAVDCCFLDIIMRSGSFDFSGLGTGCLEMNGIELAEKLRQAQFAGEIVFLTSSNEFAHQSYRVRAFDYLLKPPTPEKVRNILNMLENEHRNSDKKGLIVKIRGSSVFIRLRNISYVEIIAHTVHIRLVNGEEINVYTTLAELMPQLLSDSRFVQCHRSYIINLCNIEIVAEKQVIMRNGAKVPVSRKFSQIREEMVERMFAGGA